MESYFGSDSTVNKIWAMIEKDALKVRCNMAKELLRQGRTAEAALDQAMTIERNYIQHVVQAMVRK